MSFSLSIAKMCIDCDNIFAGGDLFCTACGSKTWVWLSRYIKELKDAVDKVEKETKHEKGYSKFDLDGNGNFRGRD